MLKVKAAHHSACGPRERNEDFAGYVTPEARELARKGFAAVIADGVSGAGGGREAAEHCARNVLADYYSTPDTWEVSQSFDRIYAALNRWVQSQARSRPELVGMATTLTSLVLRGNAYYFAHVGDTRLYLLREGKLTRLSADHVWNRPEMEHVLTRAVGLDTALTVDHGFGPLMTGDVFALLSDGAWAKLAERDISDMLMSTTMGKEPDVVARQLVDTSLTMGGTDNSTAIVLRVEAIDPHALRDLLRDQRELPAPVVLKAGDVIDGMTVLETIHQSRITMLYKVQYGERTLVLKTLTESAARDAHERLAFAHEAWLAKRVVAKYFAQIIEGPAPSALYFLSTYHGGASLAQRLESGAHFTVPEALRIATGSARAMGALHRRSIVHRDIKPDNLHLGDDGQLRLLDLGVASSGFEVSELAQAQRAGTPSYLAPELFGEGQASAQSDIYAWAVTLYVTLTRRYPYGEVEPFQTPRFADEPTPPTRYRPDIPGWLENILLKALAVSPSARFETAEELLLQLEQGPLSQTPAPKRRPLATRNVLLTWQVIALASLLLNLIMLLVVLRK